MALVFGCYKLIVLNYILSQIQLEAKGYGIKKFITNFMNQLNYTLDATNILEYNRHGRVLLLPVSKKT